jgi:DNA-binding FadR family transcriptional regulator
VIVAAIKKRVADCAEKAMRKHLTSIRTLLFGDR